MGFFDDLTGFLDDVRQVGEELDDLKQEVIGSVTGFGQEAAETVAELKDTLTGEDADA